MTQPKAQPKTQPKANHKVKNITGNTINLASGIIPAGKTGIATTAECSTLYKYIERV